MKIVVQQKNQIFWSFMNGKLFKFFKVSTVSKNAYKFMQRYFSKSSRFKYYCILNNIPVKYKQFESDLIFNYDSSMILKLNHLIGLKFQLNFIKKLNYQSRCQINIECD